ncbi:SpoIIE family protein phosphatase [Fuchsiella alkaliacetigena]|uniref:SpoIIE family protein phosphatase n=1 Tax=Fuchsiella alkaliacetigena TaxID=957042 RepID=UPI00200B44FD|nr:SpoIIE family protein phosphatase [Fuchsiella alkaliacetigena]
MIVAWVYLSGNFSLTAKNLLSKQSRLFYITYFSLFSLIAILFPIQYQGITLCSFRAVGPILGGLFGGPYVGGTVSLLGGMFRMQAGSCLQYWRAIPPAFLGGVLAGLTRKYKFRVKNKLFLSVLLLAIYQLATLFLSWLRIGDFISWLETLPVQISAFLINLLGITVFLKVVEQISENKKQMIELEDLYNNLETQFEKGRKLHEQFLPSDLPELAKYSYSTYFQPAEKLGGDFYDLIKIKDQLIFYLADVSGHSLDGSMLNIFLRETINNYLLYQHSIEPRLSPSNLIEYIIDRYQQESFPDDYFICLLLGVLDLEEQRITFANAGFQVPPIIAKMQGEVTTLSCGGMPISSAINEEAYLGSNVLNYQEEEVYFKRSEVLLMTTDGLIEEISSQKNIRYGEQRLQEVLAKNYYLPPDLIKAEITADFKSFSGQEKGQDDITFLILKNKLPIIDQFERTINSSCQEMYQIQEELREFIVPYCNEAFTLIWIGFQELISNAIEHGNCLDEDKQVEIKVEINEKYIKASIKDEGVGFDWQKQLNQELNLEHDLRSGRERGRGIKIAKKLYDEVWYNETGNQVNFLKYREKIR